MYEEVTRYCIYSPSKGYWVKKIENNGSYVRYWFNNVKEFDFNLVKLFTKEELKGIEHGTLKFCKSEAPDSELYLVKTLVLHISED